MRLPMPPDDFCPRHAQSSRLPAWLALLLICSLPLSHTALAQENRLPSPPPVITHGAPVMVAPPAPRLPSADCVPELNLNQPSSWRLTDSCSDPQIHGILQQLLNQQRTRDREQSQRYPRLIVSESQNEQLYWQLPDLTRGVRAIMQMAKLPQASEAETQAASALAAGKPELAIAVLGKMATGTWAARLLRQQAALQRTIDLTKALALAEQAAALDEGHQFNLRNLANWAEMAGNLSRALDWHRMVARRLDSDLRLKPDNTSLLWSISHQAGIMANLEYELHHTEESLKHLQRSTEALRTMQKKSPQDVNLKRYLASGENKVGNMLASLARHEEALKPYRSALMARQQILALTPDLSRPKRDVVVSLINLAAARTTLEQYADALELYRQALPLQLSLQATTAANADWDADLANTYNRIGELGNLLKQPASEVMASHVAARTLLSALLASADKADTATITARQRDLVMTQQFIGDLHRKQNQYTDAMASYQAALAIARKLIEQDASVNLWQHDLANTWSRMAELQKLQAQPDAALASYRIELAIRQRLHTRAPDNLLWGHELATTQDSIGEKLTELGQNQEALKAYQAALTLRQKLPGSETVIKLRMQAASWAKLAAAQYRLGQWEASLQSNEAELGLRRKVVQLAPNEPAWQREVALMGLFIGDLQQILNRPDDALRQYRDSISQLGGLAGASPASDARQSELAISHGKVGKLLQKMDNFPAANEAFQAALAISRPLAAKHPENREMQSSLAADISYLGNLAFQQGQISEALKHYQSSLSILVKLNLAEPKQVRWKNHMATLYMRIGDCQTALGSDIDALSNFNAALVWQQQVSSELPGAEAQVDLSNNHVRIGDMQTRLGYTDATLQSFQTAHAILQPVLAREPESASLQRSMSTILLRIGDALGDMKNFAAAESHMQQALQMRQKLAQATPQDGQLQINVATVHGSLGMMQEAQNHPEQAITQFRLAQAISDQLVAKEPKNVQWQLASAGFAGRIASVDGGYLSLPARKDLLQESIRRIKRLQQQQSLPGWASSQLSQLEKKLDDLNHPERARAAAATAATAGSPGTDVTPGSGDSTPATPK